MLSSANKANIEIDSLFEGIDLFASITRARFEELNADLFGSTIEQVEKCLLDADMEKDQIDDIVMVGGSTRIPMVQELLQDFFNGKELNKSINPDEAVAYGAAVQAAILNEDIYEEIQGLELVEVAALSLGIDRAVGAMAVVIKRNTRIPTKHTRTLSTQANNQSRSLIQVYEGEQALTKDNNLVATFGLTGIPPAPRGVPQIEVTFDIDANGILNVSAVENSTGKENKITVTDDRFLLKKSVIERMVKDAEMYRAEDENQKHICIYARNELESDCYHMKSAVEDGKLKEKISESDKNIILDKCNEVIRWLDDNQHAEKEKLETQQKELESVFNRITTKRDNSAGDRPRGLHGGFPGAAGPAPDCGETPGTEHLQGEVFGRPSRGEQHKEFSDICYGGAGEKMRGKQSYIAHVRNLAITRGLRQGFEAKHLTLI
jgi:L1 cell adhesion molecule like protein